MGITGTTRIFTILAHPATRVVAPSVFNFLFEELGLDMTYLAHDVAPESIDTTIAAYRAWENLGGFNVTVPHKEAVAKLADRLHDPAGRIGAVNTVVRSADGSLDGWNTDGMGALKAIGGCAGARCLVLGAGGAARAITERLIGEGAAHVAILNRTAAHAEALMALFEKGKTSLFTEDALEDVDIVVQATPLADRVPFGLDLSRLKKGARVLETIMRETSLGREASSRGLHLVPGHLMLLHQTGENFERMTGLRPDEALVRQAFRAAGYPVP